jgi:hypothetical protein
MATSHIVRPAGVLVLLVAVCASASGHAATSGSTSGAKSDSKAGFGAGARATTILGAAWHADNSPIPSAKLRLRNVQTGRIEATAVANELGQFSFTNMETGTYVIELVSDTGKVLALGHTFTVAPGETIATFVRLGSKVPWFSAVFGSNGFFSNAASIISSSAASTGVTAIAPEEIRCVSPPCSQ